MYRFDPALGLQWCTTRMKFVAWGWWWEGAASWAAVCAVNVCMWWVVVAAAGHFMAVAARWQPGDAM